MPDAIAMPLVLVLWRQTPAWSTVSQGFKWDPVPRSSPQPPWHTDKCTEWPCAWFKTIRRLAPFNYNFYSESLNYKAFFIKSHLISWSDSYSTVLDCLAEPQETCNSRIELRASPMLSKCSTLREILSLKNLKHWLLYHYDQLTPSWELGARRWGDGRLEHILLWSLKTWYWIVQVSPPELPLSQQWRVLPW